MGVFYIDKLAYGPHRFMPNPPNPVPGLDRDTYLSPGSVYGEKKFGFWYGVLSYIGSYYARISYHFCVTNKISNA